MRVFDLCGGCANGIELLKSDPPVSTPVIRCCRVVKDESCLRLGRLWPLCKKGEDVFSKDLCAHFMPGAPVKLSLMIVAATA